MPFCDEQQALRQVVDVSAGLASEAELFCADEPGVLLWSAEKPSLVCPSAYARKPGFESAVALSARRGWPVVMRPTGGGAVPQGPGVLNLAIAATVGNGFTIEDGYRLITQPICTLLEREGLVIEAGATPGSFCDGSWNLSEGGRKIVGTAQRWRPNQNGKVRILAHALVLMNGEVEQGASAVDAFHSDLGLDIRIRSDAHTTLEKIFGLGAPDMKDVAAELHQNARQELAFTARRQNEQTAA